MMMMTCAEDAFHWCW